MAFALRTVLAVCALVCLAAVQFGQAHAQAQVRTPAQEQQEQSSVRAAVSSGRYKPLADILRIAEQHVPGRVLEIEMDDDDGLAVYELEILDARNRKREIKIDAATGQVLEIDDRPVVQTSAQSPAPTPAQTQSPPQTATPAASAPLSVPQMLRQVLQQYPGYVEELQLQGGARDVYAIRIIQAGQRHVQLHVDAATGEILANGAETEAENNMHSLHDILETLLQRHPGVVIEAELEREPHRSTGNWYYEIDIRLTDGRVMEFEIDPQTARVLREKFK